ncbi:hypothetical protein N8Z10_00985 [bacterium]|nr:hypothetical protein [bacterium]
MTRREKQRELFIELINYQLEEHGVTYEDVRENAAWYMEYKTTPEKEKEFLEYAIKRISDVLKIGKEMAKKEANWFLLQWGLTTNLPGKKEETNKNQKRIKGK